VSPLPPPRTPEGITVQTSPGVSGSHTPDFLSAIQQIALAADSYSMGGTHVPSATSRQPDVGSDFSARPRPFSAPAVRELNICAAACGVTYNTEISDE
jgi:hypothetical protein